MVLKAGLARDGEQGEDRVFRDADDPRGGADAVAFNETPEDLGNLFGGTVYSTPVMIWSFLGQVLRDGKEAACQAAVARIVAHQQAIGGTIPTSDTGDYFRARAKLSEDALHDLVVEIGAELEWEANAAWLWKDRHAKLVDGFTFTMPDMAANQAEYPQQKGQKRGVGLPIARVAAILSLATGCILDAAVGP